MIVRVLAALGWLATAALILAAIVYSYGSSIAP